MAFQFKTRVFYIKVSATASPKEVKRALRKAKRDYAPSSDCYENFFVPAEVDQIVVID